MVSYPLYLTIHLIKICLWVFNPVLSNIQVSCELKMTPHRNMSIYRNFNQIDQYLCIDPHRPYRIVWLYIKFTNSNWTSCYSCFHNKINSIQVEIHLLLSYPVKYCCVTCVFCFIFSGGGTRTRLSSIRRLWNWYLLGCRLYHPWYLIFISSHSYA